MPMIPLNDLRRGNEPLRGAITAAMNRVAASGHYLQGPERAELERELAAYVGVHHCVGVATGTDAITLALLGAGCSEGDEILTAANAGAYTTTAALRAGMLPRYADVDADTLCLSRATVEQALSDRTRAVVVTHLYGRLADVEEIAALCAERSLVLVEDCAQAIGARRAGGAAGSFGDAAAFSFYPTKNLGAMGDAGAVVTNREDVEQRVRSLSQYGWEGKYRIALAGGRNSRIDELQAAVLRVKLPHLDAWAARRREVVSRYAAALPSQAGSVVAKDGEDYVGHLAVLRTPARDGVRAALTEAGVATDIHYPVPDHRQPFWNGAFSGLSLPVTEAVSEQVLTLPCFPALLESEVAHISDVLDGL